MKNITLPTMVLIPEGSFMMGTSEDQIEELFQLMLQEKKNLPFEQTYREIPQFPYYLLDFEISKFPITNMEYAIFINDENYHPPLHWEGKTPPVDFQDHPVVNVNYYDGINYCKWFSTLTGWDIHLPSEAEWEKAARGTAGLRYPWGNVWNSDFSNNIENGQRTTSRVGQYSPFGDSPYGCSDMIGNVWEWNKTRYGGSGILPIFRYPYTDNDGREFEELVDERILRGGSFLNGRGRARCGYRGHGGPLHQNNHTGFRVARKIS